MAKTTSTFGKGMLAEISMQATRDGENKGWNFENALGTLVHAAAGYFAGWGLRKAFKPNYKGIFVRN